MKVLDRDVLVLNKSWTAIHITTVRDAICSVMSGRSHFIDTTDYNVYNFDEWIKLDVKAGEPAIHTVKISIRVPKIMRLDSYSLVPEFDLRISTANIALRDAHRCQYCGKKLSINNVTIDHVVPQSKGGKNTWENLVCSCFNCNVSKGDRTPIEAGMSLLNVPKKPSWKPLLAKMSHDAPEEWRNFVKGYDQRPSLARIK